MKKQEIQQLEDKIEELKSRIYVVEMANKNLEDIYQMIIATMGQIADKSTQTTKNFSTAIVGLSARVTLLEAENKAEDHESWKA